MNENTVEHLKLIQQVVDRMGRNSFQLKGWTVVLGCVDILDFFRIYFILEV